MNFHADNFATGGGAPRPPPGPGRKPTAQAVRVIVGFRLGKRPTAWRASGRKRSAKIGQQFIVENRGAPAANRHRSSRARQPEVTFDGVMTSNAIKPRCTRASASDSSETSRPVACIGGCAYVVRSTPPEYWKTAVIRLTDGQINMGRPASARRRMPSAIVQDDGESTWCTCRTKGATCPTCSAARCRWCSRRSRGDRAHQVGQLRRWRDSAKRRRRCRTCRRATVRATSQRLFRGGRPALESYRQTGPTLPPPIGR